MPDAEKQSRWRKLHPWAERKTVIERRAFIDAQKRVPCADCGVRYPPYVMHFDHVRGRKLFNIGGCVGAGVSHVRLLREIAKCEIVCANCHSKRTWGEG